ncbi:MAG: hypothetical protein AAGH90_08670 [Pseudomonadota bacterium]
MVDNPNSSGLQSAFYLDILERGLGFFSDTLAGTDAEAFAKSETALVIEECEEALSVLHQRHGAGVTDKAA